MRKIILFALYATTLACALSCASTDSAADPDAISLDEAIERSAAEIAEELPGGTRLAIVAFSAEHPNFSNYIMDELTGALVDRSLEVADRRNLEYVYNELNFQMSGDVSDEAAVSIGKFLGAKYVITGQLLKTGNGYRYRVSGINVELAVQESSTRLNIRNDQAMQNLLKNIRQTPPVTAAAAYNTGSGGQPRTAGAFLDRGILFGSRGDFALAIEDFTEAIRLDPNNASAYLQRSKALHAGVSKVSDLDENFEFLISGTSYSEETRDGFNRALEDATAAIRLAPALASAYRNRGRIYDDMGEHDKAVNDFNQALKLDPNYAHAYYGRGRAYGNKKDYDRAIADYTQAIKIDPNYTFAYHNRGIAYRNKEDYDRAIADCEKVIRLDPNDAKYTTNLASAYNARGNEYHNNKKDYDRAMADYNQAIRLNPNEAMYARNLAIAYTSRGNAYWGKKYYARARGDYEQALRFDPNNTAARNNLEKLRNMGY
jgi:tetratricopeptide (TPR) repeat protein